MSLYGRLLCRRCDDTVSGPALGSDGGDAMRWRRYTTICDGMRLVRQANREDEEHERKAANRRCDYSVVATLAQALSIVMQRTPLLQVVKETDGSTVQLPYKPQLAACDAQSDCTAATERRPCKPRRAETKLTERRRSNRMVDYDSSDELRLVVVLATAARGPSLLSQPHSAVLCRTPPYSAVLLCVYR